MGHRRRTVIASDELYRTFGIGPDRAKPSFEGLFARLQADDRPIVSAMDRSRQRGDPPPKAAEQSARTPIIGLSGRALEGDHEVAISKGMDAYLTKPLMVRDLQASLEQLTVETPPTG